MSDRRPRFGIPSRRPRAPRPAGADPAPEVSMEARPEDVAAPVEQSMVDAAIYVEAVRVDISGHRRRGGAAPARPAGRLRLDRPVPAERVAVASGRRGVRAPRGRRRGRDRRAPAAEAGALRRHPLRRAPRGDLSRRRRGGRVRRDPRLRRAELRAHGAPQPDAGPRAPSATGWRPTRSCSPAVRRRSCTRSSTASSTAMRRSSPACRRTSRRSRSQVFRGDPSVSRADLRAVRRGHRVPALDATAPRDARRARRRLRRSTARTRSCSATCATWPTMPRPSPSVSPGSGRACRTSSRSTRRS